MKIFSEQNTFLFQTISMIIIVILVHGLYVGLIRPNASSFLQEQTRLLEAGDDSLTSERPFYVIVKDYEQEACFIMLLWALVVMGYKANALRQNRQLLEQELIRINQGMSILPTDTRNFIRPLQALPKQLQDLLLPRVLLTALQRFAITNNIQDVGESINVVCEQESDQLDSELSMMRYIAWAIPSVGFIGTVRGIGAALGEAHKAVEGDIAGVTANLGVAFNSTFIALILSIILMFFLHQLQLMQERLVADTRSYVDQRLLHHMKVQ